MLTLSLLILCYIEFLTELVNGFTLPDFLFVALAFNSWPEGLTSGPTSRFSGLCPRPWLWVLGLISGFYKAIATGILLWHSDNLGGYANVSMLLQIAPGQHILKVNECICYLLPQYAVLQPTAPRDPIIWNNKHLLSSWVCEWAEQFCYWLASHFQSRFTDFCWASSHV